MSTTQLKPPEEREPWLGPALAGSKPILYPRSEKEQAASAEWIQEQTKNIRWDRRSAKVKLMLISGVIALLVGIAIGVMAF